MDDKKATRHKVYILLFGVVTFVISVIASLLVSGLLVWLGFGRPTSYEEIFIVWGDLGTGFMLGVFLVIFPLIAEGIGLLIHIRGYRYAQRKEEQSQFRNYWLLYPIVSITIFVILYSAPYWLPSVYR
ncbi:MAG: hypothetical protein DWQ07_13060 [Chloroflexi bacterium]|nr:MAG: hypothetical protein DWQ07_13060 [Chloroflexota bacterium]MBL1196970.1 hypothetical protein [Chloroflexota bacterium]NOH14266.1 hypothetical protein [Chloroflexota bacterium]